MPDIHVERFHTQEQFQTAFLETLREELQHRWLGPAAIMIPGGRTPVPVFNAIVRKPFAIAPRAYIMYTDDRHVPEDSPESNYGASKPMLQALKCPPERVIRVHTDLPLEAAAERYHAELESFLDTGGRLVTAFLGLGPDGHTCSLFTQDDLDKSAGRYAAAIERPLVPHRVSVTPELLEKAERIILLAAGAEKKDAVEQLLRNQVSITAGKAVMACANVELWIA